MSHRNKDELPTFTYHPDPVGTGAFEERTIKCESCHEQSRYAYLGPLYADKELQDICPWCIKDGTLCTALDAQLQDEELCEPVDNAAHVEELLTRTPGFSGWQTERWLSHCGDFCAYKGHVQNNELHKHGALLETVDIDNASDDLPQKWRASAVAHFSRLMDGETPFRIHIFECLHCGKLRGYVDHAE